MALELSEDFNESSCCCMAFDSDALTLDEACFHRPGDSNLTPSLANMCNANNNFSEEERKSRRYKRRRGIRRKKITQEEAEWQRIVHITVERNRRKQVKDHLTVLRCMTPPSYIPRGDQASVIGGTIEFIEDLKKTIHSLQHQKTLRIQDAQKKTWPSQLNTKPNSSSIAHVEVQIENEGGATLIVQALSKKSNHQLLRLLLALKRLAVVITHLKITTLQDAIMYSMNIQIEENCNPDLHTANTLAASIYGIFKEIHLQNINEIS